FDVGEQVGLGAVGRAHGTLVADVVLLGGVAHIVHAALVTHVALWFASGNLDALARTIADIAEAELAAGAITQAASAARESLAIVREIGGLGAFTPVLPLAASVALAERDEEQAEALIGEARAIAKRLGARLLEAETLDAEAQ